MIKVIPRGELDKYFGELEMAEKLREQANAVQAKAARAILNAVGQKEFIYNGKVYQIRLRYNKEQARKVPYISRAKAA